MDLLEESNKLAALGLEQYDLAFIRLSYDDGKLGKVSQHMEAARQYMRESEELFKEWLEKNEKP